VSIQQTKLIDKIFIPIPDHRTQHLLLTIQARDFFLFGRTSNSKTSQNTQNIQILLAGFFAAQTDQGNMDNSSQALFLPILTRPFVAEIAFWTDGHR
jgi:hypothetical protein